MNTAILMAVIGFVFAITLVITFKGKIGAFLAASIFGPLDGFVIGMVIALAIGSIMLPTKTVVYGPGTLVAMRSSDGFSGTFIWGSGSIGSSSTYNFMQRMDDGSLKPGFIYVDETVRVIEDPELKDVGYWRTTMTEADRSSPWSAWSLGQNSMSKVVRQEFRVPKGTVVQEFKIK